MGFVWADTITASVTAVKTTHVTELQTNIDTDRVSVGLGGYAWQKNPTPNKSIITSDRYGDMVTALDEAYDANTCSGHDASHFGSVNSTHNDNQKTSDKNTHMSGHFSNHKATYYATDKAVPHFSSNLATAYQAEP
jgi:hypothetical protein